MEAAIESNTYWITNTEQKEIQISSNDYERLKELRQKGNYGALVTDVQGNPHMVLLPDQRFNA